MTETIETTTSSEISTNSTTATPCFDAVQLHATNIWVCTGVGLPANLALLWLIARHTKQEMRQYSRILLQTCVTDLAMVLVQALTQPMIFVDDGANTVLLFGPLRWVSNPCNGALWYAWAFLFYVSYFQFSTQFFYRFQVVTKDRQPAHWRYLLVLFFLPSLCIVGLLSTSVLFQSSELYRWFRSAELAASLGFQTQSDAGKIVFAARADNPYARAIILLIFVAYAVSYAIVLIFCTKTQRFIRANLHGPNAARDREVNRQVHRTLCIQAFIPLLVAAPTVAGTLLLTGTPAIPSSTFTLITMAFVQVSLISVVNFASSFMFLLNNIFPWFGESLYFEIAQLWCGMQIHGLPPIIYLCMNETIQQNCLTMLEMLINKLSGY